jgi:IS5 family transposase
MLRALKPRNFIFRIRRIASHDSVVASEVAMRPKKQRTTGSGNLFRARLDRIINMKHELVQLAGKVDGTGSTASYRRKLVTAGIGKAAYRGGA